MVENNYKLPLYLITKLFKSCIIPLKTPLKMLYHVLTPNTENL